MLHTLFPYKYSVGNLRMSRRKASRNKDAIFRDHPPSVTRELHVQADYRMEIAASVAKRMNDQFRGNQDNRFADA